MTPLDPATADIRGLEERKCPNCGATHDGGGQPVIILPMLDCCGKLACNVCSAEGFVCPHCE